MANGWAAWVGAAWLAVACGGPGPAQAPVDPPPLDEPGAAGGGAEPASSPEVAEATSAIEAREFARARELLERAVARHPRDAQAAYYMGLTLEGLGEPGEARKWYEKAIELDPALPDASVNLSGLLIEAGETDRALAVIRAALKRKSQHPGLLVNFALALEAAGDRDGALKAYAAAVQLEPTPEVHFAYAELLAQAGRRDEAIEQLRKVASEDPSVMVQVANLMGKLEAFADCVAVLDKLLTASPSPELHVRRGACRHGAKDDPGALADYDAALALKPGFTAAHFYRGQHLRLVGKKPEAIAAFRKVVELAGEKERALAEAAKKELAELGAK